ncbi:hypothetical protein [Microbacterium paludicola]|uniref:hypothetical protein n=1 Tax=Microbacterium paludicola TaxID=300019 RepID=UPI0011A849CC|nr:hypothetical protein [Microbacterium paludicola]
MVKTNRELIEDEIEALLEDLNTRQQEIRTDDAALRVKRDAAEEVRLRSRNLRMALFAIDGETSKTLADADAANEQYLDGLGA